MTTYAHGKLRHKKTLCLPLRLILGRDGPQQCKHQHNKQKQYNKNPANCGERRESDFQIYHIIIFKSRVQQQQKNHKTYEETEKDDSFEEKKNQQNLSLRKT